MSVDIDQQQRDITTLDGAGRAQHAEFLNARADLASLADTCRINQYEFFPLKLDLGVNRIARRARDIADNRAFDSQNRIE